MADGAKMQKKIRLINLVLVLLSTISITSLKFIIEGIIDMVIDSVEDGDADRPVTISLIESIRRMSESIDADLESETS